MKKFFYFHLISVAVLSSFFLKAAGKFTVKVDPNTGKISAMGEGSFDCHELSEAEVFERILNGNKPSQQSGERLSASQLIERINRGDFSRGAASSEVSAKRQEQQREREERLQKLQREREERLEERQREREERLQEQQREREERLEERQREAEARAKEPKLSQEEMHELRMNQSGTMFSKEQTTLTPQMKAYLDGIVEMTPLVVQTLDYYALRYKRSTHPEEIKRIETLKQEIGPIDFKEAGCFKKFLRLKQENLGSIFAPVPVKVVELPFGAGEIRIQKTKRTFLITASYSVDFKITDGNRQFYDSMYYKDQNFSFCDGNLIHQQENGFLCVTLKAIDTSKLTLSYTIKDEAGESHKYSVNF